MPNLKYYNQTTSQWETLIVGARGEDGATGPVGPAGTDGEALPAGSIIQWGSNSLPTNWLLCDGSAVLRSAYPSLFAAIGTNYGAGDGTTTFNLPNLKGRVAVGRDSTQAEFDTLGEVGGAKTHTLTTAEMPSHTHTQNAHSHVFSGTTSTNGDHIHQFDVTGAASGGGLNTVGGGAGGNLQTAAMRGAGSHTHTVSGTTADFTATNQNTGGGGAHNNLQPYQVFNYIIKTSAGTTAGDSELATRLGVAELEVDTLQSQIITKANLTGGNTFTGNQTFNSGIIRMPNQPAFYARGAEAGYSLVNQGDIPFNNAEVNIGNYFNTSNFRFTAPVAGMYQINTTLFALNAGNRASIKVNGGAKYNSQNNSDAGNFAWAGTIYLNANDYVTIGDWQNSGGYSIYMGHSSFSGFLVG